jgi:hypothetical protein
MSRDITEEKGARVNPQKLLASLRDDLRELSGVENETEPAHSE